MPYLGRVVSVLKKRRRRRMTKRKKLKEIRRDGKREGVRLILTLWQIMYT